MRSLLISQIFRHCPESPVQSLEGEDELQAFAQWWKDEVAGRQPAFAPAFELPQLHLVPPFHTCWTAVKARRDEAARALSTAGDSTLRLLWEALGDLGENWAVGREAFTILSSWYGQHFPHTTAFLPHALSLRSWPEADIDPPGPSEIQKLVDQWVGHFGEGATDSARKCDSALGLIEVDDTTLVYGVDLRDQLVIVVTYDTPSEGALDRVSQLRL